MENFEIFSFGSLFDPKVKYFNFSTMGFKYPSSHYLPRYHVKLFSQHNCTQTRLPQQCKRIKIRSKNIHLSKITETDRQNRHFNKTNHKMYSPSEIKQQGTLIDTALQPVQTRVVVKPQQLNPTK